MTSTWTRRRLLQQTPLLAGAAALASRGMAQADSMGVTHLAATDQVSPARIKAMRACALACLQGNIRVLPRFSKPVLIEGAVYPGVWQECGPHEGLVYAAVAGAAAGGVAPLDIARHNHEAFFALQREDGQMPASVKTSEAGFGQIQMVVPIAATAWEVAQQLKDAKFLETAYAACARWDAWLRRYRNTRGTLLVEGFCTYDTGHDNSPRWAGIPNRCPDADARKCPSIASMPRLCPDLSATVFGGRVALAAMADALGKRHEAQQWRDDAEHIRRLIIDKLYCAEDGAFYDLDAQDKFVRVRGDVITRVLGEHVLRMDDKKDRAIFEAVWSRQLGNPKAFAAPFPFPSIAMDDPAFVRPIPRNSWGGAAQALTALRTPRWMTHYGKARELRHLMQQWVHAIALHGDFRQQMDPLTGQFTTADPGGYSPAALTFLLFTNELVVA